MKRLLVIFCCCTLLAGCSEPLPNHQALEKETVKHSNIGYLAEKSPADNPLNLYDPLGKEHNMLLDSLREYSRRSGDTSRKGLTGYLVRYFKKYRNKDIHLDNDQAFELSVVRDYKAILFSAPLSGQAMTLLLEMVQVLESIKSTAEFSSYYKGLAAIENRMLKEIPDTREKNFLLITAAMLRHSGYYWMDYYSDPKMTQKRALWEH